MNSKVTINIAKLNNINIIHLATYKLLVYILYNYDTEINKVRIDKNELVKVYNYTYKSIRAAIQELIDNNIINKSKYSTNWYNVNNNVFINFISMKK